MKRRARPTAPPPPAAADSTAAAAAPSTRRGSVEPVAEPTAAAEFVDEVNGDDRDGDAHSDDDGGARPTADFAAAAPSAPANGRRKKRKSQFARRKPKPVVRVEVSDVEERDDGYDGGAGAAADGDDDAVDDGGGVGAGAGAGVGGGGGGGVDGDGDDGGKLVGNDGAGEEEEGEEEEGEEEEDEDEEGGDGDGADVALRRTRRRIYDGTGHMPAPPLGMKKRRMKLKQTQQLTRAQARKNCTRYRDFLPGVEVTFDLSCEPCLRFSLRHVADAGVNPEQWTSYKLKSLVLYLETATERFELSRESACSADGFDLYCWSRVRNPVALAVAQLRTMEVPLAPAHVEVLHRGLDWCELVWRPDSVTIRGTVYGPLQRLRFRSRQRGGGK